MASLSSVSHTSSVCSVSSGGSVSKVSSLWGGAASIPDGIFMSIDFEDGCVGYPFALLGLKIPF